MIKELPDKVLSPEERGAANKFYKLLDKSEDLDKESDPILPQRRETIKNAFWYSFQSHHGQRRENEELYIYHPLDVAFILHQMGFRGITLAAGLLHDSVSQGKGSYPEIESHFGSRIRHLVEGVSQLKTRFKDKDEEDARNIKKVLISALKRNASEIRIFFIKVADRLHNARTLQVLPDDRKMTKAFENLYIYGPLAGRLSLTRVSWELEDLAFKELYPDEYNSLKRKTDGYRKDFNRIMKRFEKELRPLLARVQIKEATIDYRIKHLWSIRNKMLRQKSDFRDIYDIAAIRIIVNTVEDCWKVFATLNFHWPPRVKSWNNYIDHPKVNGYQSIHTNIAIPDGLSKSINCLEVQIRTHEMHELAERGSAAHWRYSHSDEEWLEFLHIDDFKGEIDELARNRMPAKQFRENIKLLLTTEYIFVRTPRGDGFPLPVGATPVDFAYKVHTHLGNHCKAAEIEGKKVALDFPITQEGVHVKIIKSDTPCVSPRWLDFIKTATARQEISRFLNRPWRNAEGPQNKGRQERISLR